MFSTVFPLFRYSIDCLYARIHPVYIIISSVLDIIIYIMANSNTIVNDYAELERSSRVSSKCVVFIEILVRNLELVFLEHHEPTQHG